MITLPLWQKGAIQEQTQHSSELGENTNCTEKKIHEQELEELKNAGEGKK